MINVKVERKELAYLIEAVDDWAERIRRKSFSGISLDEKAKMDFLVDLKENLDRQFAAADRNSEKSMIENSIKG